MLGNKKSSGDSDIPSTPENAKDQKKRTRTFIMIGLLLGMLMSAMNQTIVGTSIPKIVGELGGMGIYSWLFTAYILGEIITILIAGKMSDRMGRRPVFLAGTIVFLAGTILATTASSMEMLIFCMLVQGLGSGVIMPVAMTTVADLYPPTEIGKMQGIMGAVFAVASVVGPFLGGFIVDNAGWRYVFVVAVPLGITRALA